MVAPVTQHKYNTWLATEGTVVVKKHPQQSMAYTIAKYQSIAATPLNERAMRTVEVHSRRVERTYVHNTQIPSRRPQVSVHWPVFVQFHKTGQWTQTCALHDTMRVNLQRHPIQNTRRNTYSRQVARSFSQLQSHKRQELLTRQCEIQLHSA